MINEIVFFDLETTSSDPENAKIVEIGAVIMSLKNGIIIEKYQELVNPVFNIPPEATAVHHITNQDVLNGKGISAEAAGFFLKRFVDVVLYMGAHHAEYDIAVAQNNFDWNDLKNTTICTERLAKHLIDTQYYNLQYLRYDLGIDIQNSRESRAMAHTALADAELAAKLFWYLLNNTKLNTMDMADIHKLCWSPIREKICHFNKHRGELWVDVPTGYIHWILGNIDDLGDDLRWTLETIVKERSGNG